MKKKQKTNNESNIDILSAKPYEIEIVFTNNPETYTISNAVMLFEGNMVRFTIYSSNYSIESDIWYPMCNIARIERYYENN